MDKLVESISSYLATFAEVSGLYPELCDNLQLPTLWPFRRQWIYRGGSAFLQRSGIQIYQLIVVLGLYVSARQLDQGLKLV